jgi:hypothetical protein
MSALPGPARRGVAIAGAVLVASSVIAVAPPRAVAATTVSVPDTIDRTGATDVTDALTTFFAGLGPGATVELPANGRYRVDGTIVLTNRRDLTVDGRGSTFFAVTDGSGVTPPRGGQRAGWPRLRQQWRIRGGANITLHDFTVRGANANGGATTGAYVPRLEGQAGIAVQRATGVTLDAVHVTNTYGDAVYVTGRATNVMVRNSTLERTGRQGVAVVSAQHVTIADNVIRDVARSVFDLEPPPRAVVRDVHLQGNRVGAYGNFLLAAGGAGPGVGDVWLQANQVDGGHGVSVFAGVTRQARTGFHILDNAGTGEARPAGGTGLRGLLQLVNLGQVEVRGNHQRVAGVPAVSADRVCGLTLSGNDFPGASTEHEVVRACGAAAPAAPPATEARPPGSAPSTPATTIPAASADGGGDTAGSVAAGLGGFVLGLGVAAVAFVLWRRSRSRSRG